MYIFIFKDLERIFGIGHVFPNMVFGCYWCLVQCYLANLFQSFSTFGRFNKRGCSFSASIITVEVNAVFHLQTR